MEIRDNIEIIGIGFDGLELSKGITKNTKQEIRNHSTLSTHSYRLQAIIQTSSRNGKQRTTNRKQKKDTDHSILF